MKKCFNLLPYIILLILPKDMKSLIKSCYNFEIHSSNVNVGQMVRPFKAETCSGCYLEHKVTDTLNTGILKESKMFLS